MMRIKRINKEIELYNQNKNLDNYPLNLQYFLNQLNICIQQISFYDDFNNKYNLIITKNNTTFLDLKIPRDYPFKSYMVNEFSLYNGSINDNYFKYLFKLSDKLKNFNKKILYFFFFKQYNLNSSFLNLSDKDCFCCSSIICSSKWNPKCMFINLIFENLEMQFIDKYTQQDNYYDIICLYYQLYNKTFNILPKELVVYILSI